MKDPSHKINMNELHERIIRKNTPGVLETRGVGRKRETANSTASNFQSAHIGEPHYISLV
jgi:hypothetical protein